MSRIGMAGALLALLPHLASAFVAQPSLAAVQRSAERSASPAMQHTVGWDGFGKGPFRYYKGFDEFMAPFPQEDRDTYPEMFALPKGCYELELTKPLGIAFEEREAGRGKQLGMGVVVDYLVEGGSADTDGTLQPGDVLIALTACKEFGPRHERKLLPAIDLDFDTIMAAIGSNIPRYACNGPILMVMRPAEADEAAVREWLKFFEIPYDHVFRTG